MIFVPRLIDIGLVIQKKIFKKWSMQLPFEKKTGKLLQLHSVRILVDVIKLQRVHRDDDDNSKKTENAFFFLSEKLTHM